MGGGCSGRLTLRQNCLYVIPPFSAFSFSFTELRMIKHHSFFSDSMFVLCSCFFNRTLTLTKRARSWNVLEQGQRITNMWSSAPPNVCSLSSKDHPCLAAVHRFVQQGRHCTARSGSGGAPANWGAGFNFKPQRPEGRATGLCDHVKSN